MQRGSTTDAAAGSGSTALVTDLYQLTMAAGYLDHGLATRRACFHHFFRRCPFGGGYAIAAGLADVLDFLERFQFDARDIDYLATLEGPEGVRLFSPTVLDALTAFELDLDIDAVVEGTAVFPNVPLARVEGSLLACQLVETGLLAIANFQTLVATKASRIKRAAHGPRSSNIGASAPNAWAGRVIELGLRRAQGLGGGDAATRAAFIGGVDATSNVAAGRRLDIPVRGTHAHSWVMAFGDEREAFAAYARSMPDSATFLVDTYDTIQGVKNAIFVAREMRRAGKTLRAIRLDSGDLDALARQARALLDDAGFVDVRIVASNDLDEHAIASLLARGAPIDVWGVGTRLVTAWGDPALTGVYKLSAIEDAQGVMQPRLKVSAQPEKTSLPGRLDVRRYMRDGTPVCDVVHLAGDGPSAFAVDPKTPEERRALDPALDVHPLLVPVMRGGKRVYTPPPLAESRARALAEVAALSDSLARIDDPAPYSVLLDGELDALRTRLVRAAGGS